MYQDQVRDDKERIETEEQKKADYSLENAVADAQWFLAVLAGNVCFTIQIGGEWKAVDTLLKVITNYRKERDGNRNSRNQSISGVLLTLLDSFGIKDIAPDQYKFSSNQDDERSPDQKLVQKQGLASTYKLFLIIIAVLYAQKSKFSPSEIKKSVFMQTILLNLDTVLFARKKINDKVGIKVKMSELIDQVITELESYLWHFAYYADYDESNRTHIEEAIKKSFNYIVAKQTEKRHNTSKTDIVKKILLQYFTANTTKDYVGLFAQHM